MIPKVCDICGQQSLDKPASLYWAWTNADGHRRAWKQKVCPDCLRDQYAALIIRSNEPVLICPQCGISTADEYDAIYLTYCIPGMPKAQSEMPTCGACAVVVRNLALTNARPLEDRGAVLGAPNPDAPSSTQIWDDLGLNPARRNG